MPVVRIPSVLRKHTNGLAKLEVAGATVREAIQDLVARYPDLGEQLLDREGVRGFVNVYVDDEDIRYVNGLETRLDDDSEMAILPAVAGGARGTRAGTSRPRGGAPLPGTSRALR